MRDGYGLSLVQLYGSSWDDMHSFIVCEPIDTRVFRDGVYELGLTCTCMNHLHTLKPQGRPSNHQSSFEPQLDAEFCAGECKGRGPIVRIHSGMLEDWWPLHRSGVAPNNEEARVSSSLHE
jgi:hypothetical protein